MLFRSLYLDSWLTPVQAAVQATPSSPSEVSRGVWTSSTTRTTAVPCASFLSFLLRAPNPFLSSSETFALATTPVEERRTASLSSAIWVRRRPPRSLAPSLTRSLSRLPCGTDGLRRLTTLLWIKLLGRGSSELCFSFTSFSSTRKGSAVCLGRASYGGKRRPLALG